MTGPLSFWQEALLVGLAAVSFVYVFYFRIWRALAIGSDLLFASALALTVASIMFPTLFAFAANAVIERSPLPSALDAADAKVAAIEAIPGDLIDRALAKLGVEPDEDPVATELTVEEIGPFVSAVRPSADALVTTSLRTTGFLCGSFLMLTSLAMRSSTTTAHKLSDFEKRIEALESAVAAHDPPSQVDRSPEGLPV